MNEDKIIKILFQLSKKAYKKGDVPVSAILVYQNKILFKAYNKKERIKDITAHAEILAIKKAAKKLKRWNLNDCDLYVTLKPCSMCESIIKQSRIRNVYYLLENLDYKHEFSKTKFLKLNHIKNEDSYRHLLSSFFQNRR